MKNKPLRHKDFNTFKFQPFAERISNIDIDVFHRIGHENEADTDSLECHFYQAITNWGILNLTEGFDRFKKEVKAHTIITLPQLILHKQHVVEVLLKHLRLKNPLSLQPMLDLVVALAKDLRKDFYEYFNDFFEVLISLLNTKNTELLEWSFSCLAYLFKFLWRPLLKDITSVFNKLIALLSSSYPNYIHNFAASSFAFVARKVKDWPTFLSHILKIVKTRKDGIEGCGRLFFEVVHGVSGNFHSSAQTVIPFLFESLQNSRFPQNVLFEILEQMIENITTNIHPQKNDLFWNCLLERLKVLLQNWKNSNDDQISSELNLMLKLLGQSIEFRRGKFLQNPTLVIAFISEILNTQMLPETVLQTTTQISVVLLQSKSINLSQEQASIITRKILLLDHESVLLYFVKNINEFSAFEAVVLPIFLKHCFHSNLNDQCLLVLTETIMKKSPICLNGIQLPNWRKYSIDFGTKENNLLMENIFLENLNSNILEKYVSSLICLPHLHLTRTERITSILVNKVSEHLIKIETEKEKEDSEELNKVLFLLNNTIETLIHLNDLNYFIESFNTIIDTLMPLVTKEFIWSLNIIDLLIFVLKDNADIININVLEKINSKLCSAFTSPFHEIRLLVSHIYTFFENLPHFDLKHSEDSDVAKEKFQVFSICYKVESIESHVHTYRDQLQNLEKLNFDKPQMIMCNKTDFCTIPLRYLCGALYMNFKLVWHPILKIIETHAHNLEINEFWAVYGEELKRVVVNVKKEEEPVKCRLASDWTFLVEIFEKFGRLASTPDFVNFRLLLWKAMDSFADVAEAKTRDVSELFLDFIETEYTKNNSTVASKWNIKQNSNHEIDPNSTIEEEEPSSENRLSTTKSLKGKSNLQALQTFLSVFSKFRSPKSMYREPELNKLYFDLLQHKQSQVQKLALDCILTYKQKFLTPYKDHLYNLIDDKNFKNELTTFQIDKESANVQNDHRNDLIPLVMKIVFSKMSSKTGLRTGGKSSGQMRRNLVFRFLAGCEENEMLNFTKMTLQYYSKYINEDPNVMIENLTNTVTLENFIPPKRLQSSLNLLNVILDQFGGLMGNDLLSFIIQIVILIGGVVKIAFDALTDVHSGYWTILRNIRTLCIKIIERFFGQFDKYPWTHKQINTIFKVFVWPSLSKLSVEGIHSPTALLKLLHQWGSNPRYFSLLVKHEEKNEENFVLPHLFQLLLNDKSKFSVVNVIEEIVEKLLTLQADEEDLQLVIPIDNLLPIQKNILDRLKVDDKLNYGSCILLPYVPLMLEKIKRQLQRKNKALNQRELFILSRISELVWEPEISNNTLKLLLPQVLKRCSLSVGEEVMIQMLTTVGNLLKNVTNSRENLRQIVPLFAQVSYVSGRKLLLQSLSIFGTPLEISLINGLNAFDKKWIDQPDFQRRHDTFKEIQEAISEEKIDLDLGLLLLQNLYYLLKNEKDLALRENSSHCFKLLCSHLLNQNVKQSNDILNDTIFNLIRNGMKSRNDDFRNECIVILGHLARECHGSHLILRDLHLYTNKDDLEVDFFENLTHLQVHRHARALLKFCTITKDLKSSPNVRSLTQFILPFASFYLCNEKFVGKNSVVDAAIECIGTVCRILPWHQYESVLKFYLGRLKKNVDYQKQLVRITVAILDAFHYDLSKAQMIASEDIKEVIEEATVATEIETVTDETEEKEPEEEKIAEDGEDINGVEESILEVSEELDETEDEVDDENSEFSPETKICEKVTVLCKSTATRVIKSIQNGLLPQLHQSLAVLTQHDSSHKINRKKTSHEREEEDLLRVPISLALVKLLQRLPKEVLESNLPGIFMKLCTFLKSHLESVRRITRETLQKIMQALGPDYLNLLLGEMTPLLNRGFHVHVLVFTVHAVLSCLKDMYKPTDIDKVLLTVLQLCQADLFGSLSEEKEVTKIAVKTSEAKSTKSFDTFQILAKYVTEKCFMDLILPIKNVLQTSHSYKTVHKAEESLRYIALGLIENDFVQTQSLLIFAYGTSSESIPALAPQEARQLSEKEKEKLKRERPDCYIIPKPAVGRKGVRLSTVKSSTNTNAHLMVEFGLRLCHLLLKRDRVKGDEYKGFLDPFVPVFENCLSSKHIKLSILTLQCLSWILKFDLPSLQEKIQAITENIFAILHKYASAGLSKGDNFDLVMAAFKAMAVLVRDAKYHTIDTEQLKVLLLFAEQDMYDHDKQATAFNLLRAIIARKLIVPEIHEVMTKVAELSITSELNHVRVQARTVFYHYLMDYPLGDMLDKYVSFYLSQMSYEMQFGRESAIEIISSLISSFPMKVLKGFSGTLFVTLGARLVNDELPECRKQVSDCIVSMLNRLEKKDYEPLYDIVILWLKDKNIGHRRLAAQLLGIFASVEKATFESRLKKLLPLILKQFVLKESRIEEKERIKDHHLFQVLQTMLKICNNCPSFLKMEESGNFSRQIQSLLGHPHEWVRLAAAQFLGFVLAAIDIDELATVLSEDDTSRCEYLYKEPMTELKTLTLDLCDQLQPGVIKSELAEQVIKNLVFITRVLEKVPADSKINLLWLTKRMRKIVNSEVVENSSTIVLRTEVFKWIGAVSTVLSTDSIIPIFSHLLAPLVREMITTEESNAPLRQLSKEVSLLLKKKVGLEVYTQTLSSLQQILSTKRAERKRSRTQLAVSDPELFAQKKIKRHEKKKELKKRKIEQMKGKKTFKKRKVIDLDPESEVM